jgi:hypothetical protein
VRARSGGKWRCGIWGWSGAYAFSAILRDFLQAVAARYNPQKIAKDGGKQILFGQKSSPLEHVWNFLPKAKIGAFFVSFCLFEGA